MATPSSFGNGNGDNMNASLWGDLQIFIDLSMIYAKLPLAPFFCLCQVCKEWNRLASDCQFLKQNFKPPISSNPYFILTRPYRRDVLLISDGSSWTSMPVPQMRCEMSGLLFEDSDRNRVFDIHTRVFHTLPPLPVAMQLPPYHKYALTMMTTDTSQIPYGFRIIIADEITGTRIYESNCGFWTHKPSTMYSLLKYHIRTSCVHYNKSLYFTIREFFYSKITIQTYNLERDEWNQWDIFESLPRSLGHYCDIGVWQDRWFLILEDGLKLTVWEFATNFEKPWTLIDCMPIDLHKWIEGSKYICFMTKWCGEHVLVYNHFEAVNRAILYNLDQKTWDKIELPTIPMLQ